MKLQDYRKYRADNIIPINYGILLYNLNKAPPNYVYTTKILIN